MLSPAKKPLVWWNLSHNIGRVWTRAILAGPAPAPAPAPVHVPTTPVFAANNADFEMNWNGNEGVEMDEGSGPAEPLNKEGINVVQKGKWKVSMYDADDAWLLPTFLRPLHLLMRSIWILMMMMMTPYFHPTTAHMNLFRPSSLWPPELALLTQVISHCCFLPPHLVPFPPLLSATLAHYHLTLSQHVDLKQHMDSKCHISTFFLPYH